VVGRNACAHGLARRGLIARKPDTASSVVTRGATRAPQKARRRQQPKNRRLRVVKLRKALFVGVLRCAQDKLKLRPPENRDSIPDGKHARRRVRLVLLCRTPELR
jgi:hypothetical protein